MLRAGELTLKTPVGISDTEGHQQNSKKPERENPCALLLLKGAEQPAMEVPSLRVSTQRPTLSPHGDLPHTPSEKSHSETAQSIPQRRHCETPTHTPHRCSLGSEDPPSGRPFMVGLMSVNKLAAQEKDQRWCPAPAPAPRTPSHPDIVSLALNGILCLGTCS